MTIKQVHPMQELKDQLNTTLLMTIPKKSNIYYIEYPIYENIGDILIMKGTEKFFLNNEINVIKKYSLANFPKGLEIPEDIIIVCQGGGNFGDLYQGPQQLREHLIEAYPNNKIVILPQTIHFQNENNLERSIGIFSKHSNLHLFVRDENSYNAIKSQSHINVYLCPDMAHQLWPLKNVNTSIDKTLYFIRTDSEGVGKLTKSDYSGDILDWPTLLSSIDKKVIKVFQLSARLDKILKNRLPIKKLWDIYSDYLVNKSTKIFSKYKKIESSRLHGHLLACLLDKENIVRDNSYGKNSTYYNAWTIKVKNTSLK